MGTLVSSRVIPLLILVYKTTIGMVLLALILIINIRVVWEYQLILLTTTMQAMVAIADMEAMTMGIGVDSITTYILVFKELFGTDRLVSIQAQTSMLVLMATIGMVLPVFIMVLIGTTIQLFVHTANYGMDIHALVPITISMHHHSLFLFALLAITQTDIIVFLHLQIHVQVPMFGTDCPVNLVHAHTLLHVKVTAKQEPSGRDQDV